MNRAQLAKYHCLKRDWAIARGKRSMPADQAALDALQVRTIGRAASSTTFSQVDLDKMVAAFMAEIEPANFNAQMQQQDQPMVRRLAMEKRLLAAGAKFITGNDADHVQWKTIRYVQGVVENLGAVHRWPIYDEALLARVTGIMEARAEQVARKNGQNQASQTPASMAAAGAVHRDDDLPF